MVRIGAAGRGDRDGALYPKVYLVPGAAVTSLVARLGVHFLLLIVAGWINRQQQEVIDYLRTENHVLKEKLGKRRILLNDDQRRRLAVKAKVLGRIFRQTPLVSVLALTR